MKNIDRSLLYKFRLVWEYKDVLRNHCPFVYRIFSQSFRKSQLEAARKLKDKECLRVAFLLPIPGMWKLDSVFQVMQKNPKYKPYIVILPYSTYKGYSEEEIESTLSRTERFVKEKGYEYVLPINKTTNQWMDIKKEYHPDIVFFCTPYKDSMSQYFVYHFQDVLTCYVQYSFCSLENSAVNYNLIFHNLVGIHFLESTVHQEMARKVARNKAVNTFVSGYPATEIFLDCDYKPANQWKIKHSNHKKVIWAPHHSIDYHNYVSTFLSISDDMIHIAEKYKDTLQFVFKPHQTLKLKLQQIWGVEKTEEYYNKWKSMENTQLISDGYEDLFLTSDAMIHDCGSFTTEYLFTKKPVLYLCRTEEMADKFNEFGVKAFNCHYKGSTIQKIESFLQDVVIAGNDPMKSQREQFFNEYLKPKDGILPSQKILQVIEQFIDGEIS